MMARSTTLQHKAGNIDARPPTASSSKSSCYARPDHTFGSIASVELPRQVGFTPNCGRIAAVQPTAASGQERTWAEIHTFDRAFAAPQVTNVASPKSRVTS